MNCNLAKTLKLAKELAQKDPDFLVANVVNKALRKRKAEIFTAVANHYHAVNKTDTNSSTDQTPPCSYSVFEDNLFQAYPWLSQYVVDNAEKVNQMLTVESGLNAIGATLSLQKVSANCASMTSRSGWFTRQQNNACEDKWQLTIVY